MISRRTVMLAPLAAPLAAQFACAQPTTSGKMQLSIHQNTSRAAGFRGSLEGWAKAGIRYAEITDNTLQAFLDGGETLASAKRVLDDNGLTPVSGASVLPDVWIPGEGRMASLETWRRRCDQFAQLGLDKVYCPSITSRRVTAEDFAATPQCIQESGDIAKEYNLTAMIEFARTSTHLATLRSTVNMIRAAGHPNVRPMLDFFHFWSGLSKFEDLDMLQPGELAHCHFQDLLDAPPEMTDNNYRLIPGDGRTPIVKILQKLDEKEYRGALSVELFLMELANGDPFEVGSEIKTKCEAVMSQAGVL